MRNSLKILKFSVFWELLPYYGELDEWFILLSGLCKLTRSIWEKNKQAFKIWGEKYISSHYLKISDSIVNYMSYWQIQHYRKNLVSLRGKSNSVNISRILRKIVRRLKENSVLTLALTHPFRDELTIENLSNKEFTLDFKHHHNAIERVDVSKNTTARLLSFIESLSKSNFNKVGYLKTSQGIEQITIKNWHPCSFIKWNGNIELCKRIYSFDRWDEPFGGRLVMNKYPNIYDTEKLKICFNILLNLGRDSKNVFDSFKSLNKITIFINFSLSEKLINLDELKQLIDIWKNIKEVCLENWWICDHDNFDFVGLSHLFKVQIRWSYAVFVAKNLECIPLKIVNGIIQTNRFGQIYSPSLSNVYTASNCSISYCEKIEVMRETNEVVEILMKLAKDKYSNLSDNEPYFLMHIPNIKTYIPNSIMNKTFELRDRVANDILQITFSNNWLRNKIVLNWLSSIPTDINIELKIGATVDEIWINNKAIIDFIWSLNIIRTEFLYIVNKDLDSYLMKKLREQKTLKENEIFICIVSKENLDKLYDFNENSETYINHSSIEESEIVLIDL